MSGLSGKKTTGNILVVDDSSTNRLKISLAAKNLGLSVETAKSGPAAFDMLSSSNFDLVLLDLVMPEMDGFAVLAQMKDNPDLRGIPVIVVSAVDELESVIKAISLGAEDYLSKDFDPILFKARVLSCLEKKQLRDRELAMLTERSNTEEALRKAAEQAQASLSRYFSPNLVRQLVENPDSLDLSGERRELSFVFTDLAEFTPLVESLKPEIIIPLLNEYLDGLTRIVFEFGGTVDKIVGDAVHAIFGAPMVNPEHEQLAVFCAMELDRFSEAFRQRQKKAGIELGVTRIGVHCGPALVGNFGGESYFDYTAHGNAINTTARLEAANKHLGTRICISEQIVSRIPNFKGRPVGKLVLKGSSQEIMVYEPLSDAEETQTQSYKDAYRLMESLDPTAGQAFAAVVGQHGEDSLSLFHLKRLLAGERGSRVEFAEK